MRLPQHRLAQSSFALMVRRGDQVGQQQRATGSELPGRQLQQRLRQLGVEVSELLRVDLGQLGLKDLLDCARSHLEVGHLWC